MPPAVLDAEKARIAAIHKAIQPTVAVFANEGKGGGSGVVISPDGYALTNYHVVQPAGSYMKCGLADGRLYEAVVVGIDPTGDVGVIKLLGRDDFPTATMADSNDVKIGDWCFAVGNPFLLATDFQPTVTYGIVSGTHRYQPPAGTLLEYTDCIQTDAAINPGNSGGPLFNANGDLIGINGRGSFEKRGRVNVGVGYAISINQIKNFLGCLKSGRIVDHATLGATVAMSDDGSVRVSNILESSDAYRRGLRYDDQIVAFGGRPIDTPNGFKNVLGIFPKGWRVPLTYRRDGKETEVLVRLAGVHGEEELIQLVNRRPPQEPAPDRPRPRPGERPMPGEEPKPPPMPMPRPAPGRPQQPAKAPIPPEIQKLIKARPGYANYYFNELNRDRVWSAFAGKCDYASAGGAWKLAGEFAAGGKIEMTLAGEKSEGKFPQGAAIVEAGKDLDQQLDPPGSGGVLAALHLWRQLLISGPQKFGDVVYYGTAPYAGIAGQAEVLVATHNVAEVNFVFDPASGQLALLEMTADPDADPCEIRFGDYRDVGGRLLPHRLEVRSGDAVFGTIQLQQVELSPAETKP
ncbi:MAG TPA: trypsin-like peptidase domain-containing protein [Pirellulaceae bacterium]|nr:trypsin-like peptidase domain-containing protein [Pirellulaceae bacterium]